MMPVISAPILLKFAILDGAILHSRLIRSVRERSTKIYEDPL